LTARDAAAGAKSGAGRAFRRMLSSDYLRNISLVAGGGAFVQALSLCAAPFLTRLYAPADFGVFAVFVSLLLLCASAATLRFEIAIPLADTDGEAGELLALALALAALAASLVAAVLAILGPARIDATMWLLPFALAGLAAYNALSYWRMRQRSFEPIVRGRIAQGVGKTGLQLALGVAGAGALGLVAGETFGRLVGAGVLAARAIGDRTGALTAPRLARLRAVAGRHFHRARMATGSALLEVGALQAPPLLLAASFEPAVVGWYALAQQVLFLPIGLLAQSVAQAYIGRSPEAARAGKAALRRVFLRTAGGLLALGAPFAAVLMLWGPELFGLVFGARWAPAGEFAGLLAPGMLAMFAVAPLAFTMHLLGGSGRLLLLDAARFAAMAAAFGLIPALGGSPAQVAVAFSAALVVSYAALFAACLRRISRAP
jgi:O-antigen/teichoic acid export membrane protein